MKGIKEYINESKTRFEDIEKYGTSWISEWNQNIVGTFLNQL